MMFKNLLEQLSREEFRQLLRIQDELEEKLENIPCEKGEYSIKIKIPNIIILSDPNGLTDKFIINKFKDEYGFTTDNNFLINIGKSIPSLDEVVDYCKFDAIVQFLKSCGAEGNLDDFYYGVEISDLIYENILNYMKSHNWKLLSATLHGFRYWSNPEFDNLSIRLKLVDATRYDIREKYTIQITWFD